MTTLRPMSARRFPIIEAGTVDWAAAEQAYRHFVTIYGHGQTLHELATGDGVVLAGFGILQFCEHYRGREMLGRTAEECARLVVSVMRELGDRWQL